MTDLAAIRDELRALLAAAPDGPPWIRLWESLDVHGMRGDGVLTHQRNIDLAVAAVNALPELLAEPRPERGHSAVMDLASRTMRRTFFEAVGYGGLVGAIVFAVTLVFGNTMADAIQNSYAAVCFIAAGYVLGTMASR